MEGNKGFEAPKEESHIGEEAFDHEVNVEITHLDEERILDEEFEIKNKEISERILEAYGPPEVLNVFRLYTDKEQYIEFTQPAVDHVQKLIEAEVRCEDLVHPHSSNIINFCDRLTRFGFPQEDIADAILKGLIKQGVNDEGQIIFDFKDSTQSVLDFVKNFSERCLALSDLLITPETQSAAMLRMRQQGSGGMEKNMKTEKDLIRAFNLSGKEVAEVIKQSVESSMLRGDFTVDEVAKLYMSDNEILNPVLKPSLDEAWKKLQERYGITGSFEEISAKLLMQALQRNNGRSIRNICSENSALLAAYSETGSIPALITLAEHTVTSAYAQKVELGSQSFRDKGWLVGAVIEQGMVPAEKLKEWFNEYSSSGNKLFLQRHSTAILDPDIILTFDILGNNASGEAYELVKAIKNGGDGDFKHFGIINSGEAGIYELRTLLKQLKQDVLTENLDVSRISNNPVLYDYIKGYLRIDESEFSAGDLSDSIALYQHEKIHITPLDTVIYQPSEPIQIKTTQAEKNFVFSEQFLSAYRTLCRDLHKARELSQWIGEKSETKKPFSHLVEHLDVEVARAVTQLHQSRQSVPEEKQKYIAERIAKLETLNFRDLKKLEENLQTLTKIPETHSLVRQIMFTFVYSKRDPDAIYSPQPLGETPTLDGITSVINFVDHIGYQETWSKYFKDKRGRNNFRQIASTRALEEELTRIQRSNEGTLSATTLQFIPTRGLLMELSGSLGDACWQDTNDDLIAMEHPNFTSVTFVQNPETKDERIAGACMLIETQSADGRPLLIIRGLNPIQNVINRLWVNDFYEKFTAYCKEIAGRSGRELAIVIDDHSGGSSTNRPVLFQYLRSLGLRKVVLASDEDTEFNGYNITNDTFLID